MKSLERGFNSVASKNPSLSSYACFAEAVIGQNFGEREISYWFNKLVDKGDYLQKDKKDVLFFLGRQIKPLRKVENRGKSPHTEVVFENEYKDTTAGKSRAVWGNLWYKSGILKADNN